MKASGGMQLCAEANGACLHGSEKRRGGPDLYVSVGEYPASAGGGFPLPTEINAQLHNAPLEHCYACLSTRGCEGIRFGILSAYAEPNPAPSLASET